MIHTRGWGILTVVTWFVLQSNILADYLMSAHAVGNGFYETNTFSNTVGLLPHALVLVTLSTLFLWFSLSEHKRVRGAAYMMLLAMCVIWTANNLFSWLLLTR